MSRTVRKLLLGVALCASIGPIDTMAQSAPPAAAAPAVAAAARPALPQIADAVDPKGDTQPARVNAIHFYGNAEIPTATLQQGIGIQVGEVMRPELMGKALDAIVAAYQARGLKVQVRPRVSHPKRNFVDVNFLIDETRAGGHD